MKVYKTVTIPEKTVPKKVIPARTDTRLVSTNCDICKQPIHSPGGYDVEEVEVYFKDGANYPEGGNGTKVYFDICATCFKEKLIPFVSSFGGSPTEVDWDW